MYLVKRAALAVFKVQTTNVIFKESTEYDQLKYFHCIKKKPMCIKISSK